MDVVRGATAGAGAGRRRPSGAPEMRILLADDHALFRDGIASLLGAWGHEVVGQAADARRPWR